MTDLSRRESEFLRYAAPDGGVKIGVLFRDETAWLTQRALCRHGAALQLRDGQQAMEAVRRTA